WLAPPRPQPEQPVAKAPEQQEAAPAAKKNDGDGDGEATKAETPPAVAAAKDADKPHAEVAQQRITLGSMDPASPYRMLVTLTNQGAAVERIELNSPRYHATNWDDRVEVEDNSGYLGHLDVSDADDKAGATVQVVGPGTPADGAGLKAGDVITSFDGHAVRGSLDFDLAMRNTRVGQQVELKIQGRAEPAVITLRPRPVQVVEPERPGPLSLRHDPLSFLTTLESVNKEKIAVDADELPGLALRSEQWEVLPGADADEVAFRWVLADRKLEFVKRYRIARIADDADHDDPNLAVYHLAFSIEIRNTGDAATDVAYRLDGPTGLPTEGSWYTNKIATGGQGLRDVVVGQRTGQSIATRFAAAGAIADESANIHWQENPVAYAGVDAIYFASAIRPAPAAPQDNWFADTVPIRVGPVPNDKHKRNQTDVTCRLISLPVSIAAGGSLKHDFKLFAGPKRPSLLAEYELGGLVNYGWFGWVAEPMLGILHFFYRIIPNYGIAIILLTVLVRSCMFPISRKQAANAAKMQELQPEIKRITEKYKGNMEARSKAQQELFRKHNYNPFAGCLPMFLQLPIFIGLYRSLSVDVELRQAPLISEAVRWCSNLAAPDMLWYWKPVLPNFIAAPQGTLFLFLPTLGPYLNVLPLVTIGLFIVQQKMFMPPPADQQAAAQMKMMQYMMVVMGLLFFKVASGLCVYFITSSLWGIAERKLLPKTMPAGDGQKTIDVVARSTATGSNGAGRSKKKSGKR
ncbi:MAG TPA: YidC/Oxa1 family insertase periplasmic-domain containing protein, partial [Pirellulales bacterium]|nr:YidC/Oxa1 family insertase periplasmic-domain containing protein [Pirellulales bacterium]